MAGRKGATLFLLLAIVVILAGVYYGLSKADFGSEEDTGNGESITVLEITTSDITQISYQADGEAITLVKKDDIWHPASDESYELDKSKIEDMLGYLTSVSANRQIESDNLDEYGLSDPQNKIIITDNSGNVNTIKVGAQNTITDDYYILINDDKTIYTVLSSLPGAFTKTLDDLKPDEEQEGASDNTEAAGETSAE